MPPMHRPLQMLPKLLPRLLSMTTLPLQLPLLRLRQQPTMPLLLPVRLRRLLTLLRRLLTRQRLLPLLQSMTMLL